MKEITQDQNFNDVTPEDAKEMVEDDDIFVLDVRNPDEYEWKRVPGVDHLIPVEILPDRVDEIEGDKLLVYCHSGSRSQDACDFLSNLDDFDEIYNLQGGITAWDELYKTKGDPEADLV
ncbi:rhodanese-like domain-containing protein [Halorutilales archaeon Cl-col2-1]